MPEMRKDLVTGQWVIIATERGKRPSDFKSEPGEVQEPTNCPFCAGHEGMTPPEIFALRPDGSKPNSPGWRVRVVSNKYPALGIDDPLVKKGVGPYDVIADSERIWKTSNAC